MTSNLANVVALNKEFGYYDSPPRHVSLSQEVENANKKKKEVSQEVRKLHQELACKLRSVLASKEGLDLEKVRESAAQGINAFIGEFQKAVNEFIEQKIKPVFNASTEVSSEIIESNNAAIGGGLSTIFDLLRIIPSAYRRATSVNIQIGKYLDLSSKLEKTLEAIRSIHLNIILAMSEYYSKPGFKDFDDTYIYQPDSEDEPILANFMHRAKAADEAGCNIHAHQAAESLRQMEEALAQGMPLSEVQFKYRQLSPLVKKCPAGAPMQGGSLIKNFTDWILDILNNELRDSLEIALKKSN